MVQMNQTFTLEKITLVPVKNVAIEFNGSRHIVVSRQHPLAEETIKALEFGIKELRKPRQNQESLHRSRIFC